MSSASDQRAVKSSERLRPSPAARAFGQKCYSIDYGQGHPIYQVSSRRLTLLFVSGRLIGQTFRSSLLKAPKMLFPVKCRHGAVAAALAVVSLVCIGSGAAEARQPADVIAASAEIPENAVSQTYGKKWRCELGYRETVSRDCAKIAVPENAYANGRDYGNGWSCHRGYQQIGDECAAIPVPEHAYLTDTGNAWNCERGYRAQLNTCVKIMVPENGYLANTLYGSGWVCERGYEPVDGQCKSIQVPANGYLSDSTYGRPWECDRGYAPRGDECQKVDVPANAHLSFQGTTWECDRPYQSVGGRCEMPN